MAAAGVVPLPVAGLQAAVAPLVAERLVVTPEVAIRRMRKPACKPLQHRLQKPKCGLKV